MRRLYLSHKAYREMADKHMAAGAEEGERTEQEAGSGASAHNFDCEDFMCYVRRLRAICARYVAVQLSCLVS